MSWTIGREESMIPGWLYFLAGMLFGHLMGCSAPVSAPVAAPVLHVAAGAVQVATSGPVAPVDVHPYVPVRVAASGPFVGPLNASLVDVQTPAAPPVNQTASAPADSSPGPISAGGDVSTSTTQRPVVVNVNLSGSAWPLVAGLVLLLALLAAGWGLWERYGKALVTEAGRCVGRGIADLPVAEREAALEGISRKLGEPGSSAPRRAWDLLLHRAGLYRRRTVK